MLRRTDGVNDWLPIIRAEYCEFPGMQLTRPQMRRLWNLDPETCDAVIAAEHFLRRKPDDVYARAD